jgi:hypothetical protein
MTFLPIVGRELRVAARKRSTFWLRVVAALVAVVFGTGFMVIGWISGSMGLGAAGLGPATLGRGLFLVLTWLSLGVALGAGVFFTSDCLSEEKREGTLGFLFLTDLRGYDVVLGKLLATSLRSCFALLAVLPILAVTLLLGSVTAAQFWHTVLALANALFLSLAAGLFVSCLSRDAQRAMMMTLGLVLLLVAGGPILDAWIEGDNPRSFGPFFSLTSPGYAFVMANRWSAGGFWPALLAGQGVAWLLLVATCLLTPRTWQEKSLKPAGTTKSWSYWWRFGGVKRRARLRRKLIGRNPVLWLACRERWQSLSVWTLSLLVSAGCVYLLLSDLPAQIWVFWNYVGGALTMVFYVGMASQAGRFFVEARRTGLIELLLAAPLPAAEIARGHWRALQRMFGLPVAIFLCASLVAAALSQQAWSSAMSGVGGNLPHRALTLGAVVTSTLVTVANLIALGWFGMWMGVTSKSANLATLKTLVFVQIVPWFVISFASGVLMWLLLVRMMMPMMTKGTASVTVNIMAWYPSLNVALTAALSLAKDVFFTMWARRKLFLNFRERSAQAVSPVRSSLPMSPPPGLLPPAGGAT